MIAFSGQSNQYIHLETLGSILDIILIFYMSQQAKHDAEVKIFEDKVVKVKEWVAQIVGEVKIITTI